MAPVLTAPGPLADDYPVEGYPNLRICNLFLSLDSDSGLKTRENLLFDRGGLTSLRGKDLHKFGEKSWARIRSFYSEVEHQVARPYGEEFVLTTHDWQLMVAEVVERFNARVQELDVENAARYTQQQAERQERLRLAKMQEEAEKEAAWWQKMNAGEIVYGPIDWPAYPDGGHGLLIRLRGGERMAEVREGDWIQISGNTRWGKVLSVYPGEPDTPERLDSYGPSITYEARKSETRGLGWEMQRVRNLMYGYPFFQISEVAREKPSWADSY